MEPPALAAKPNSSLKIWLICLGVCAGNGVPFFATLYIPNTAQASMSAFLGQAALGHNASSEGSNGAAEAPHQPNETSVTLSLLWSLLIAEMAMGQLGGYLLASPLIDRFGRRRSLLAVNLLQVPFQLCHVLARPTALWQLLYVGRGGCMLLFALSSVAVPVYLNEIAPPAKRGALGTCYPLSLSAGALLGGVLGLDGVLGGAEAWPYAFLVPMTFSLLSVPLLFLLPESPSFLAGSGKTSEAKTSLLFFQGSEKEFRQICEESQRPDAPPLEKKPQAGPTGAIARLLRKRSLRGPMSLTLVIAATFTFSGIAIVSAYSTAVMERSGLGWRTAELCTVGLKLLSFSTYLACLFLVDRVGRRVLMLSSVVGSAVMWTALVGSDFLPASLRPFVATGLLFGAQLFMNIGIRPLFYVLVPELFPFRYRTAGKAMAALAGVAMTMPLLFLFWPALTLIGSPVFLLHAAPLWLAGGYLFLALPETKGRHSAEIFAQLRVSSVKRRQWSAAPASLDPQPLKPIPVAV